MTDHLALQSQPMDSYSSATTADTLGEAEAKLLEARGIDLETVSRLGWRTSKTSTTGNAIYLACPNFLMYRYIYGTETEIKRKNLRNRWMLVMDCICGWKGLRTNKHIWQNEKSAQSLLRDIWQEKIERWNGFRPSVSQQALLQSRALGASHSKRKCKTRKCWDAHARKESIQNALQEGSSL